jgi:hypothetical protein
VDFGFRHIFAVAFGLAEIEREISAMIIGSVRDFHDGLSRFIFPLSLRLTAVI